MYECSYQICQSGMDWAGKFANPARGHLNRIFFFPVPIRASLKSWSRETVLPVPSRVSLVILYTQAQSGAYSLDPSRFLRRCLLFFMYTVNRHRGSPEFISGPTVIAYQERSLLRVRRHRASSVNTVVPLSPCFAFCTPKYRQ